MWFGFKKKKKRTPEAEKNFLEILHVFTQEITQIQEIRTLMKQMLRQFVSWAETDAGTFWQVHEPDQCLELRENLGSRPLLLRFELKDPFVNYVHQTGRAVTRAQLVDQPRLMDIKEAGIHFMTSTSADAVLPLKVGKKFLGFLALGARPEDPYPAEELELFEILANLGALALHHLLLQNSVHERDQQFNQVASTQGRLLNTVSHDLSTPISGILSLSQTLLEPETAQNLQDHQRRYLEMIHSAAQELSEVVEQILDFKSLQD